MCAVVYFVVGIKFGQDLMPDGCTPMGEFIVFTLVTLWSASLVYAYCEKKDAVWRIYGMCCIGIEFLYCA